MKKLINQIISFFGLAKKHQSSNEIPFDYKSPKKSDFGVYHNYTNGQDTLSNYGDSISLHKLRNTLMSTYDASFKDDITKISMEDKGAIDLSIDTRLILPFKSQTDMLIQLLTFNTLVSVKEAKKVGINRVMRIVSELRKKGWNIKTYVIMRDGKKEDIIYVNIEEMSNVGLETYVVK
jgi:hypothetical protein